MQDESGAAGTTRLGERELLGDYEILSRVGAGGMGLVYRALQRSLGRVVALKVIREEFARVPEYRARFLSEPRLAASVDHPHVVSVYEVGEARGQLFLAMQWIEGEDLYRAIKRSGRLAPDRVVTIVAQVARALHAVHSIAGLIHRDVKPANVLVRQFGGHDHAYLTDFGVAKRVEGAEQLTRSGLVVGTPGYLAPEQITGQGPGPASDLYALGCVFFEALTGRAPFPGESDISMMWATVNDPRPVPSVVVPEIGQRYDEFISIALAIDPQDRFGSGAEFADALEAVSRAAPPPPTTPPVPMIVGPDTPVPSEGIAAQAGQRGPETPPTLSPRAVEPASAPYPPDGYGTRPPPQSQRRRGSLVALLVVGLVAAAGLAVGALAAAGVFSHQQSASTITRIATAGGAGGGNTAPSASSSSGGSNVAGPGSSPTPAGIPPGAAPCGGDLFVGPNTSCGFAQNVEQAYDRGAGGTQAVTAFSPATGQTYVIDCSAVSPHVCTGGTTHNASIYFTSGPSAPAGNASQGLSACDQNISVNSVTTCPFAANVFKAYAQAYHASGGQTSQAVSAYSPVTTQTYTMSCSEAAGTVTCTGGNNSFVTFPLHAAQVY